MFLNPLRTATHWLHVLITTLGASLWHTLLKAAVVAMELMAPLMGTMQYRERGAT
jgi:hypothetical protein